jgi:pimeloyl-ACP methyl ester carboxylesterase
MELRLIACFLVLSLFNCFPSKKGTQNFTPSFTESNKTTHKIPKGQAYTFGYLEVLENRSRPNSKTIKIPVYHFKSRSENPRPDPVIYTVGGPGATTMPSAQYMKFYQYLDDRDFILVEQRGNFFAQPHLDCPEWSKAVYLSNLPAFDEEQYDRLFAEAAQTCKDRLTKNGIDLNGYNTNEIAADIHDLVTVLGIDEYNLLTISYSTKIAQVLLRDYPKGIRSVVMDSPLPLEASYDEESNVNLLAALDRLLADCEKDQNCHAAYPNLKQDFYNYLKDKTKQPLELEVENPANGKMEVFYLKGRDLIRVFSGASTAEVADIPFEISKLLKNDLSSVKKQVSYLFNESGDGDGIGMRLSVWCAEEYPFNSQEVIEKETNRHPEIAGLSPATIDASVCEIWSVEKVPAIENQAIRSDVPVLLISGEYDELTPPVWAQKMQKNLPYSHHLLFKGWKHTPTTNWSNPCAMKAANAFFNSPELKPEPDCLKEIGVPAFKTDP